MAKSCFAVCLFLAVQQSVLLEGGIVWWHRRLKREVEDLQEMQEGASCALHPRTLLLQTQYDSSQRELSAVQVGTPWGEAQQLLPSTGMACACFRHSTGSRRTDFASGAMCVLTACIVCHVLQARSMQA